MPTEVLIDHTEEEAIRMLLTGRRIVSAHEDTLTLDNGTTVKVIPNSGCGGCTSGGYWLEHIAAVDNIITDVRIDSEQVGEPRAGGDDGAFRYSIFVFADAVEINAVTVEGDDGNGYYGTGYRLLITAPPVC